MWLLPFANITFTSHAEADEVLSSIKDHSVPAERINFIPPRGKHYFSSFMGHRFTLFENSLPFLFPCVISGDIVFYGFETTASVFIRPGWFFLVLLVGLIIWLAILAMEIYLATTKPVNEYPTVLEQATPFIIYAVLLIIFRWKVIKHRSLLTTILMASKVN